MASGTRSLFFPVLRFWEGKMRDFVGGLVVIAVALFAFWQAALRMMAYEDAGGSMCEARSAL